MESNLLTHLLSNDNQVRQGAEAQLQSELSTNPQRVMGVFLGSMQDQNQEVAAMACILFKKYFLDDESRSASQEDLEQIKQQVLGNLAFSQPLKVLKRKGEILSKVYSRQDKSEELLQMLVQWAQQDDQVGRQFAMYVFEVVADCHLSAEQVMKFKDSFMTIFAKTLTDRDLHVRVASLKATAAFLTSIDDSSTACEYTSILSPLLNTVVEALQTNEEQGKLALQSMVDLTNTHPELFKHSVAQVVNVFTQVMLQTGFEESTRASATEVILALANNMPASLRKLPETKSQLIPALAQMLTEVEEDEQTWMEQNESNEGVDPFSTAVNAINRLSMDLGEKTILQPATQIIKQAIQSQEWKQRQAGYMLFGLIAEACKESLNKNLDEAMKMSCTGLMDANYRVRYAGLSCTALLLTETAPKAQYKYHSELVPMLMKMMKEEQVLKVQAHAVSATINFVKGLMEEEGDDDSQESRKNQKIVGYYVKELMDTQSQLLKSSLQKNYEPLQEEVLNLLSCIAALIEKDFAPFYTMFTPMMLEILSVVPAGTPQQKNLRALTIRTLGYFIESVSEEKQQFQANVTQIAGELVSMMNQKLATDDPQLLAIKETLAKVASFLQEDFQVFMPNLLQALLEDAQLDIDIKMQSADLNPSDESGKTSITLKLKGFEGEQRLSMNTSALESKVAAFRLFMMVAENTGQAFQPYCEAVLPIMVQHMEYKYSRAVRKYAMKTVKNILISLGEPHNVQVFKNIFPLYCQMIQKANNNKDLKELKLVIKHLFLSSKALSENNKQHRNYMEDSFFQTLGPLLNQTLTLVKDAKTQSLNTTNLKKLGLEMDEEDMETLKEELAKICSASTFVMELSGNLAETFFERAAGMIKSNLLTYFALNLNDYKNLSKDELLDASCFFCDFIEYAHHTDEKMLVELTTKFIEIFNWTKEVDCKQTFAYGLGVFSMFISQQSFAPFLSKVYHGLIQMMSEKDAYEDEKVVATENAVGALGKIIYFHKDNQIINEEGVLLFLSKLPLKNEEEEATKSHRLFLQQVQAKNPRLVTPKTAPAIKQAVKRIWEEAESNDEVVVLCEQGKQLAAQLM